MSTFPHSQSIQPLIRRQHSHNSEPHTSMASTGHVSFPPNEPPYKAPVGSKRLPPTAYSNIDSSEPKSLPPTSPRKIALKEPYSLPISHTEVPPILPFHYNLPLQPQPTDQPVTLVTPKGETLLLTITCGVSERPKNSLKWMSETHVPLKDLPTLGTNNSGFFMGQQRAQRVDISEQLKLGVRLLDLAIVQYYDEIYLDQYKHIYDLCCPYITVSEALLSIKLFLEINPNEVLYLHLRTSDAKTNDLDREDPIDSELLEAKFDVIKKFFFEVHEINLDFNARQLTASKKNIICFATNLPCFHFLLNSGLSLYSHQLVTTQMVDQYYIADLLKQSWTHQKSDASVINPYEKRFSWFIIDAVTADRDASVLKEKWAAFNKAGKPVPFHFFSLCKVTQKTWTDFKDLILYKHPQ